MKLQKLTLLWYQRLRSEGFKDIENENGSLKSYDRRTVNFDNRETILEFFTQLDSYILNEDLKILDRQILSLYTEGMFIKDIATALGYSRQWVTKIIRKHKIIMGFGFVPKPKTSQPRVIIRKWKSE